MMSRRLLAVILLIGAATLGSCARANQNATIPLSSTSVQGTRATSIRQYTPTHRITPISSEIVPGLTAQQAYDRLETASRIPVGDGAVRQPREALLGRFESEAITVPPPLAWGFVFSGVTSAGHGPKPLIVKRNVLIVVDAMSGDVVVEIHGVVDGE